MAIRSATAAILVVLVYGLFVGTSSMAQDKPEPPAPKRKAGLLELYEKIKPGMTRDQVEAVLGKSVIQDLKQPGGAVEANYVGNAFRERAFEKQESPFVPAGIYVIYLDGKVTKKAYNSQWLRQTAWGKAVDGVEYGFEFKDHKRHYKVGQDVTFILKARNTSDKPVTFEQVGITGVHSGAPGGASGASVPKVIDATTGTETRVFSVHLPGAIPPATVRKIQLAAKETTTLGQVAFSIGPGFNMPHIEAGPGIFLVRFDTVCWLPSHQRPTGTMEFVVLPKN